nr:helix-turn-helix domain-containing protein [Nocardioides convexus]
MPPHRYLVGRRIDAARRALLRGERPADVAAAVGFHDQAHLHRHFRRMLGVTPGSTPARRRPRRVLARVDDLEGPVRALPQARDVQPAQPAEVVPGVVDQPQRRAVHERARAAGADVAGGGGGEQRVAVVLPHAGPLRAGADGVPGGVAPVLVGVAGVEEVGHPAELHHARVLDGDALPPPHQGQQARRSASPPGSRCPAG